MNSQFGNPKRDIEKLEEIENGRTMYHQVILLKMSCLD